MRHKSGLLEHDSSVSGSCWCTMAVAVVISPEVPWDCGGTPPPCWPPPPRCDRCSLFMPPGGGDIMTWCWCSSRPPPAPPQTRTLFLRGRSCGGAVEVVGWCCWWWREDEVEGWCDCPWAWRCELVVAAFDPPPPPETIPEGEMAGPDWLCEGWGRRPLPRDGGRCQRSVDEPTVCFSITENVLGALAVNGGNQEVAIQQQLILHISISYRARYVYIYIFSMWIWRGWVHEVVAQDHKSSRMFQLSLNQSATTHVGGNGMNACMYGESHLHSFSFTRQNTCYVMARTRAYS